MSIPVGTVNNIWRYPVKSMQGESLTETDVDTKGILGDRAYALWDVETQRVASAKNPKKWSRLLEFQAQFQEKPTLETPPPAVNVLMPNGASIGSDHPDLAAILSQMLGREVKLLDTVPVDVSLDKYSPPNIPGIPDPEETTQLFLPPGTFFDSCNIHLLTTSTLTHLQSLYPQGNFHPCRFRPNLLIDPASSVEEAVGFIEESWVGGVLAIGERVRLQIESSCPRCVVTTLAQQGLPQDLNILRTTAIHNHVNAGIRASVLQDGAIHIGDAVILNPD